MRFQLGSLAIALALPLCAWADVDANAEPRAATGYVPAGWQLEESEAVIRGRGLSKSKQATAMKNLRKLQKNALKDTTPTGGEKGAEYFRDERRKLRDPKVAGDVKQDILETYGDSKALKAKRLLENQKLGDRMWPDAAAKAHKAKLGTTPKLNVKRQSAAAQEAQRREQKIEASPKLKRFRMVGTAFGAEAREESRAKREHRADLSRRLAERMRQRPIPSWTDPPARATDVETVQ